MLPVIVDRYHTTNRTATCNRPVFLGARGWPICSMVMVKIYDNGTYIGNSPLVTLILRIMIRLNQNCGNDMFSFPFQKKVVQEIL